MTTGNSQSKPPEMQPEQQHFTPQWVDSVLEVIGHTPMIRLKSVSKAMGCTVLAKVESLNPGLSAKDRVALEVLERAEKEGKIKPGGTIIESTSGNTGFSMGPHLHFVVQRNRDGMLVSLPVEFAGAGGRAVTLESGVSYAAY